MAHEHEHRRELIRVAHRLYDRELIVATDGNLSCRLTEDRFLTTPSGFCKGELTSDDLVVVDRHGRRRSGRHAPSSEFALHAAIYAVRPDVMAVVHAHPPLATAFTVAGRSLEAPLLTEVVLMLGTIPTAPYATPGSIEVAADAARVLATHDACLMAHHGAVTVGRSLREAHQRMEVVEQTARVALAAHALGGARPLPDEAVATLLALRSTLGLSPAPGAGVTPRA